MERRGTPTSLVVRSASRLTAVLAADGSGAVENL